MNVKLGQTQSISHIENYTCPVSKWKTMDDDVPFKNKF